MLIVPPCGPWEIYPQRRACNRLVSHFPATYQRRWSTCSDGCSTSNKTVDRHPCLTLVLFNSISMEWGGSVLCWEGKREGEAFADRRRSTWLPFGLCSLPGTFLFFQLSGKLLCRNQLRCVFSLFLCFFLLNVKLMCLSAFSSASSSACYLPFFFACQMLVVIYQLTVMTIEIHMGANISQVATRNKLIKWQHITHKHIHTKRSNQWQQNKVKTAINYTRFFLCFASGTANASRSSSCFILQCRLASLSHT